MNTSDLLDSTLAEFAQKLGIGPLARGKDGVSVLSFDEIDVLLTTDNASLTLFTRVGVAPEGDADLLDALLAANLFWQETGGATLSLEPYSRVVIMAQRLAAAEVMSSEALEAAVETFTHSAMEWKTTISHLGAHSSSNVNANPASDTNLVRA